MRDCRSIAGRMLLATNGALAAWTGAVLFGLGMAEPGYMALAIAVASVLLASPPKEEACNE